MGVVFCGCHGYALSTGPFPLLLQGHMHTQKMRQANREAASVTLDNK